MIGGLLVIVGVFAGVILGVGGMAWLFARYPKLSAGLAVVLVGLAFWQGYPTVLTMLPPPAEPARVGLASSEIAGSLLAEIMPVGMVICVLYGGLLIFKHFRGHRD